MSALRAEYKKFTFPFIKPMGTSRGVLFHRETFILALHDDKGRVGFGECAPLSKLSFDDKPEFETFLKNVCLDLTAGCAIDAFQLADWPAIRFGVETATLALRRFHQSLFATDFTRGLGTIPTNGLIAMASPEEMLDQVFQKVEAGFRCIKIKVGANDFDDECRLLHEVRKRWAAGEIELRLDANGAFSKTDALEKLHVLAGFQVHSIEQPIRRGTWQEMAHICTRSPLPIALDEELIGIHEGEEKRRLLETIRPAFLILKPTLLGGFAACQEWISLCESHGVGFWVTSILESNIGLNAIAQWTSTLSTSMTQGLGTGRLFSLNFELPITLRGEALHYAPGCGKNIESLSELILR